MLCPKVLRLNYITSAPNDSTAIACEEGLYVGGALAGDRVATRNCPQLAHSLGSAEDSPLCTRYLQHLQVFLDVVTGYKRCCKSTGVGKSWIFAAALRRRGIGGCRSCCGCFWSTPPKNSPRPLSQRGPPLLSCNFENRTDLRFAIYLPGEQTTVCSSSSPSIRRCPLVDKSALALSLSLSVQVPSLPYVPHSFNLGCCCCCCFS